MIKAILVAITAMLICLAPQIHAANHGFYSGTVKTEWLPDGRTMRLLEDFSYTDPNGLVWTAREGVIVDGASIPRFFWAIVGPPLTGKYREASVIHDIACEEKTRTWEVVHLAFYYAMVASGVDTWEAKSMYAAVEKFGPRWDVGASPVPENDCTRIFGHCLPWTKTASVDNRNDGPNVKVAAVDSPDFESVMSQERFNVLLQRIRIGEEGGDPMTLEEIQQFE
jgi:hypothetical protein